jgi:hypothetical protein
MDIPSLLEQETRAAVRYGLHRVGYGHAECVPIDVPFYGEFWRPDQFLEPPEFEDGLPPSDEEEGGFKLPDFGRYAEGALEFADRYLNLSGKALELILQDTLEYLEREDLRTLTDDAVDAACHGADEAVLVGFSMGSIVGYHLLEGQAGDYPVKSLITCGSPIGQRDFYRRIVALAKNNRPMFPACLRMWANIWNDDDPATQVQDLTSLFPSTAGRRVQSARSYGRPPSVANVAAAHNASDYLSSKTLAAALSTALLAAG